MGDDLEVILVKTQWLAKLQAERDRLMQTYTEDVKYLMDERATLAAALRTAGVGLVGSLHHEEGSCNEGMDEKCFVCEGLIAVRRALDAEPADNAGDYRCCGANYNDPVNYKGPHTEDCTKGEAYEQVGLMERRREKPNGEWEAIFVPLYRKATQEGEGK